MHDRDLYGLLERTSDAAFAVTDSGDICSWNESAEALFGFQRDAVIGKTCFQLFEGHDTLVYRPWCPRIRTADVAVSSTWRAVSRTESERSWSFNGCCSHRSNSLTFRTRRFGQHR